MEWKLELVPIPVSDVDRAKAFYTEKIGFDEDLDHSTGYEFRVVQLTPPGSACSIAIGTGIVDTPPGSVRGLHLVVPDGARRRASSSWGGASRSAKSGISTAASGDRAGLETGTRTSFSAIRTATAGPCSSCPVAGRPSKGGRKWAR